MKKSRITKIIVLAVMVAIVAVSAFAFVGCGGVNVAGTYNNNVRQFTFTPITGTGVGAAPAGTGIGQRTFTTHDIVTFGNVRSSSQSAWEAVDGTFFGMGTRVAGWDAYRSLSFTVNNQGEMNASRTQAGVGTVALGEGETLSRNDTFVWRESNPLANAWVLPSNAQTVPMNFVMNYLDINENPAGEYIIWNGERVNTQTLEGGFAFANNLFRPMAGAATVTRANLVRRMVPLYPEGATSGYFWTGGLANIGPAGNNAIVASNIYEIWTRDNGVQWFALVDGVYRQISMGTTVGFNVYALVEDATGINAAYMETVGTGVAALRETVAGNVPVRVFNCNNHPGQRFFEGQSGLWYEVEIAEAPNNWDNEVVTILTPGGIAINNNNTRVDNDGVRIFPDFWAHWALGANHNYGRDDFMVANMTSGANVGIYVIRDVDNTIRHFTRNADTATQVDRVAVLAEIDEPTSWWTQEDFDWSTARVRILDESTEPSFLYFEMRVQRIDRNELNVSITENRIEVSFSRTGTAFIYEINVDIGVMFYSSFRDINGNMQRVEGSFYIRGEQYGTTLAITPLRAFTFNIHFFEVANTR